MVSPETYDGTNSAAGVSQILEIHFQVITFDLEANLIIDEMTHGELSSESIVEDGAILRCKNETDGNVRGRSWEG